jgi:hypothetical protein
VGHALLGATAACGPEGPWDRCIVR